MTDYALTSWAFLWENVVVGSPMFLVLIGFVILFSWLVGEKPSIYALLPVGMFTVFLALNLLWNIVDIPEPVGKTVNGEFTAFDETKDLALMEAIEAAQVLVLSAAERQGVENAEQLVVAVTHPSLVDAIDWAKKIFLACIYATAVIYSFFWLWHWIMNPRVDLFAKMTASALVFAEVWTILVHVIGCDIILAGADRTELNRIWGMGAYTSVCDREVFPGFEAIPIAVFLAALIWLSRRYSKTIEDFQSSLKDN